MSLQGLGYSGLEASLRSGYPFFAALGLLAITSTISDKYQRRASVCIFNSIVMIIGFTSMSMTPLIHRFHYSPSLSYAPRVFKQCSVFRYFSGYYGRPLQQLRIVSLQPIEHNRISQASSLCRYSDCLRCCGGNHWKLDFPWSRCSFLWPWNLYYDWANNLYGICFILHGLCLLEAQQGCRERRY
jgi:hypothetical protein